MAISFHISESATLSLKGKRNLRHWITELIVREKKKPGAINFVFMSDEELLKFNRQYLDHDTFTDIITFDNSEAGRISGDILISVERVNDNALKYKVDATEELYRVMAHGVLHLCGYSDKKPSQQRVMRGKEDEALSLRRKML